MTEFKQKTLQEILQSLEEILGREAPEQKVIVLVLLPDMLRDNLPDLVRGKKEDHELSAWWGAMCPP